MPLDTVSLITAGGALVVVALPSTWRVARTVITIVHEAGHALTACWWGSGCGESGCTRTPLA